jgi:outer membrane protein assembly factor BamE (lipoprotein component of BamABCDE complex)
MPIGGQDKRIGEFMKSRKIVLSLVLGFALVGCSPQIRNHGYVPPKEDLDNVTVGVDTRDSINETLGAPTTSGAIQDGNYYYVRSTFKQIGIFKPEEVNRELIAITFDDNGVVQNIERFGFENGEVVILDYRVTETSTPDLGFIRRLISTIGGPSASQFIR